ncbi:MAG: hypothetical protein FWF92_07640 [Oscillospiraceae bacterium]|nr:hypothetical protein [Oscillospiraceae bacterium]
MTNRLKPYQTTYPQNRDLNNNGDLLTWKNLIINIGIFVLTIKIMTLSQQNLDINKKTLAVNMRNVENNEQNRENSENILKQLIQINEKLTKEKL